eukprot:8500512-Alexandrium_andersonii.AAC.1
MCATLRSAWEPRALRKARRLRLQAWSREGTRANSVTKAKNVYFRAWGTRGRQPRKSGLQAPAPQGNRHCMNR